MFKVALIFVIWWIYIWKRNNSSSSLNNNLISSINLSSKQTERKRSYGHTSKNHSRNHVDGTLQSHSALQFRWGQILFRCGYVVCVHTGNVFLNINPSISFCWHLKTILQDPFAMSVVLREWSDDYISYKFINIRVCISKWWGKTLRWLVFYLYYGS